MITINGQKMARSLGNFITLDQLFSGKHPVLTKAWAPMTIRFFILQAHYRSTIDFSNDALHASEKGLERLMAAVESLSSLPVSKDSTVHVTELKEKCFAALNDDLNSPIAIAHLFDGVRMINSVKAGNECISEGDLLELRNFFNLIIFDILGLKQEVPSGRRDHQLLDSMIDFVLRLRMEAKARKDWATADEIRNGLIEMGIEIKDTKEGYEWNYENPS
jgi:cysteinyl-tRNA synthetase